MASDSSERTEKPTAKRKKDALEKGNVARSRELTAAVSLVIATLALVRFGPILVSRISERLADGLKGLAAHSHQVVSGEDVVTLVWSDVGLLLFVVGPIAMAAAVASVGGSLAQSGWVLSTEALQIKWDRLNPSTGLARLKPSQGGLELLKAVLGATAIGMIGYHFGYQLWVSAPQMVSLAPIDAARLAWDQIWGVLWRTGLALLALGGFDFGLQRWRWLQQLKMSKQDVRDEAKSNEGNPEIKARVRNIQREMTRRRMLTAVKRATVVITNPTHFAVALEYRRDGMAAPVVVAKGQDSLALRIRAVARDHGVPIVDNPPLARALHKGAEVGDVIPAPLFGAVAEVLAYLVRIKQLLL